MAKYPWFKFYAGDWFSDGKLRKCKAEGIAVWAQALAWMHLEDTYELSGMIDEIALALNIPESQTEEGIRQLERNSVCEVYRDHHGVVTLTSRRRKREYDDREDARERKRLERERKRKEEEASRNGHEPVTDDVTEQSQEHTRERALTSDSISNSTSKGKDKGGVGEKGKPKYVSKSPPDLSEIKAYFAKNDGSDAEAEKFRDYYESNGWKAGRNPMKSWHAAARNWIRRAPEFASRGSPVGLMTHTEAIQDWERRGKPGKFGDLYEAVKEEGKTKPLWKYAA